MSSERTKRKGKERKGKERKGQGRPDCGQEPRGAHAAVRLGSSTSSGMRGITYRNTTTSTTTSPPTAPSVHRKHRVPRPPVHARKPSANQPFSIAQPPSFPPSLPLSFFVPSEWLIWRNVSSTLSTRWSRVPAATRRDRRVSLQGFMAFDDTIRGYFCLTIEEIPLCSWNLKFWNQISIPLFLQIVV